MGVFYILLAAVLWGLLGPVSKLAFQEGVMPMEVAFWRAAFGSGLFILHAGATRSAAPARADLPAFALFGLVGVALFYAAYQFAVDLGGATLASVLLYTAPAWVALAGVFWLSERMTRFKGIALASTIAGVALVAFGSGKALRFSTAAVAWGLTAGLCYAFYYPFSKHYFRRYAPATVYAYALPLGALGLLPLVDFSTKTPAAWAALLWIGAASTYLAYFVYGRAMQRLDAARASVLATVEPVAAALIAYAWWGEQLALIGYAGAALILAGVILTIIEPEQRSTPETASPLP